MAIFFRWHSLHRTSQSARIAARFSSDRDQMLATFICLVAGFLKLTLSPCVDPHQRHGPLSTIHWSRRRHIHTSWYWRMNCCLVSGSLYGTPQLYQGGGGRVQGLRPNADLDPTMGPERCYPPVLSTRMVASGKLDQFPFGPVIR